MFMFNIIMGSFVRKKKHEEHTMWLKTKLLANNTGTGASPYIVTHRSPCIVDTDFNSPSIRY